MVSAILALALAGAPPCALSDKARELAAAYVVAPDRHGTRITELRESAPVFRGVTFDVACAAQAVAWLGSDDPALRLAGAAYAERFRVKGYHPDTFLLFFRIQAADLNDFPVSKSDGERWRAQARSETSPPVVRVKSSLMFGFASDAWVARYLLDAHRAIDRDAWQITALVEAVGRTQSPAFSQEDLDVLWSHRGDAFDPGGALDLALAHAGDPREREHVAAELQRTPAPGFDDHHQLLERAFAVGLGDRVARRTVELFDELGGCSDLSSYLSLATGHAPTLLALLHRARFCHDEMASSLGKQLRATADPEATLLAALPDIEEMLGPRMWIFGLPECLHALPPEPKPSTLRRIAEAVARHDPSPNWTDVQEAIDGRRKTATPDQRTELDALAADLRSGKLGGLYRPPPVPEPRRRSEDWQRWELDVWPPVQ